MRSSTTLLPVSALLLGLLTASCIGQSALVGTASDSSAPADTGAGVPLDAGQDADALKSPSPDGVDLPKLGPAPKVAAIAGARIEIPAAAMQSDATVEIKPIAVPSEAVPADSLAAYAISPEALKLTKPATVVLTIPEGKLSTEQMARVRLSTRVNGQWQLMAMTGVDVAKREVWGRTLALGAFSAAPLPADACEFGQMRIPDGGCTCAGKFGGNSTATAAYGFCKYLFVFGGQACVKTGYDVFFSTLSCCTQYFDLAELALGQPSAKSLACVQEAGCKALEADPMGTAIGCGAFGGPYGSATSSASP